VGDGLFATNPDLLVKLVCFPHAPGLHLAADEE